MKKFLGLTLMLMFIASNCFAMSFFQPEEIGKITYPPIGDMTIKNATYISSKPSGKFQNSVTYPYDSLIKFSDGENAIFVNHKSGYMNFPKFGDKNIENSIKIELGLYGATIFQVKNDSNIKFYLIRTEDAMASSINWICIGKKDDQWIKYFDIRDIRKKYFGNNNTIRLFFSSGSYESSGGDSRYARTYCKNDTIIMEYKYYENNVSKTGEFRFKWDDAAQWFGVEHIIY